MSSARVPSKMEVMGWGPQQLADYLKRMNLFGSDKVVLKNSISGSRFVNLTDILTNCRVNIDALTVSPVLRQDDEDFDDDYESPYSGNEDGKDRESSDDDVANDYEPTPSEPPEDHKLCPMLPIGDSEYIGNHQGGLYRQHCFTFGHDYFDVPDLPIWSKPPVLPPSSTSINRSNSSARPPPNRSAHGTFSSDQMIQLSAVPDATSSCLIYELDPCWYVGKVTRGQAEGCLRRVRMDGAYLVRDGTRQLAGQPFTLMVFYQDKVYNIQIRQQNQQFLLGTGLKAQECFPSVGDIISHYSHSPLLLIDAKNRSSCQQNQCLLSTPSGYYMKGQNWS
uniref:SH2 domain-containing protein n=1 Tax=Mola mola TaxID=94237 RepID=A0A3Q3WUU0_MOLML